MSRPRIGLVHGGATGVWDDSNRALRMIAAAGGRATYIAVNEAGSEFPGQLHHWASLHPDKFPDWIARRKKNGLPDGYTLWSISETDLVHHTIRRWRGGSSGLLGVDVALNGLKLDGAICCGTPLDKRINQFKGTEWAAFQRFRSGWEKASKEFRGRVRSMSGWTRETYGAPTREWIEGLGA